jgi:hypothetical protein
LALTATSRSSACIRRSGYPTAPRPYQLVLHRPRIRGAASASVASCENTVCSWRRGGDGSPHFIGVSDALVSTTRNAILRWVTPIVPLARSRSYSRPGRQIRRRQPSAPPTMPSYASGWIASSHKSSRAFPKAHSPSPFRSSRTGKRSCSTGWPGVVSPRWISCRHLIPACRLKVSLARPR